jgi:putative nucleotidyltransferase with HDIG domain
MTPRRQASTHLQAVPDPAPAPATGRGKQHVGHGRRLLEAIEAIDQFPVLAEAKQRALGAAGGPVDASQSLLHTVESDIAMAGVVLRTANAGRPPSRAFGSVRAALEELGHDRAAELVQGLPSSDFFQAAPFFGVSADSVRLHALAVQQMAGRVGRELKPADHDELLTMGLLHDVGKLVLRHAYGDYPDAILPAGATPEQRVRAERAALGFDHAAVGWVVARRWGLPPRIAAAIQNHHHEGSVGAATVLRLADMLVHYAGGQAVGTKAMLAAAKDLGMSTSRLRSLMYGLPDAHNAPSRPNPSPLTRGELVVMRELAEGKLYKQIARDLGRSTSTVRTHLHNIYRKLGVFDRAQAVITATRHGWI